MAPKLTTVTRVTANDFRWHQIYDAFHILPRIDDTKIFRVADANGNDLLVVDTVNKLVKIAGTTANLGIIDVTAYPYLAYSDGTHATETTAAIQAAYNAITAPGGCLYLPSGTYAIDTQLDFSSALDVEILGSGIGATIIRVTGATALGGGSFYGAIKLSNTGAGQKILRNLTIDRASTPGAAIANDNGIVMGPVQEHVSIENVEIADLGNVGILIRGNTAMVRIFNTYAHRLYYNYGIIANDDAGAGSQNVIVDGGAVWNCSGGISLVNSAGNTIRDVDIEGDTGPASRLPCISLDGSDNNVLSGLTLAKLGTATPNGTIYLNNSDHNLFLGGLCNAQTAAGQHGVNLAGTSEGNTFDSILLNGNAGGAGSPVTLAAGCIRNVFKGLRISGFPAGRNRVFDVAANHSLFINTASDSIMANVPVFIAPAKIGVSGTSLIAGDFVLSAGWGNTASLSVVAGSNDTRGRFTVTSAGTGQGANPTITLTWKDGAWNGGVRAIVSRNGGDQPAVLPTWDGTASTLVVTFPGTPIAAETYTFEYIVIG